MNAVVEQKRAGPSYATVEMGSTGTGGMLLPKSLGDVVAFAAVMARADIALPKHLRGNDGACLAVAMQAMRWEMDPFAVANKSYSVNDRLAYEAQLVAAVVHTRAPIKRRPDYAYEGEGPTRRCIVSVEMLDGSTKVYESPTFGSITTKNSPLWKSDADQQLGYFSIRSWARRHAPEVILGVYTPDELIDHPDSMRNVGPKPSGMRNRLEARKGLSGFDAGHIEAELQTVAHDPETGEVTDAILDEPTVQQNAAQSDDTFPGDKETAKADLPASDHDSPAEWLVDARRWIADAEDEATVRALNKSWDESGRWLALRAHSAADHTDLIDFMKARIDEIKAAAKP